MRCNSSRCSSVTTKGSLFTLTKDRFAVALPLFEIARVLVRVNHVAGLHRKRESQYLELQKLGDFDTKTSSWVKTPANIRELGGALYCIAATAASSWVTTVRNLTMPPGRSVAR